MHIYTQIPYEVQYFFLEEEHMEDEGDAQEVPDLMSSFKAERKKYKEIRKTQAKKGSAREEATLAILNKFKNRLKV